MNAATFIFIYRRVIFRVWFLMTLSIIGTGYTYGQNQKDKILKSATYDELRRLFNTVPLDSISRREFIANTYLKKSKGENDTINIARGYYLFSILYNQPGIGKKYADSIIQITKGINHSSFPASGYFLKGYWCYELSEYQEALHNYLIGDSIAKSKGNVIQYIENRKMIALLKNRAGDHLGALEIYLKEIDSLSSIKNNNPLNYSDYLNRLYNASLTYMHLKNLDSAKVYAKRGLNESLIVKDSLMYFDFVYNLGIVEYLQGNENIALTNINRALPHLDAHSQAMANYYKGQIALHNEDNKEAFHFFRITDSISEKLNYTFPELRFIYEYTIEHYEKSFDLENQLIYINKLLKLDSTLTHSKDLQLEIVKKYDRPILLHKKESIISSLEDKNKLGNLIILLFGLLIAGLIFLVYKYRMNQKIFLKKFNALVLEDSQAIHSEKPETQQLEVIPVEIYNNIASGLKKFETEHEFLKSITLIELAKKLDTNSTYLSKYININTNDNFSQYINKLRIQYVIERLKSDSLLRSYTIKAIAEEIGFGTAQSFTKAFFHETGIYPSYFLRKLNNN
jgi:AraC-like DNA-binding protein